MLKRRRMIDIHVSFLFLQSPKKKERKRRGDLSILVIPVVTTLSSMFQYLVRKRKMFQYLVRKRKNLDATLVREFRVVYVPQHVAVTDS